MKLRTHLTIAFQDFVFDLYLSLGIVKKVVIRKHAVQI